MLLIIQLTLLRFFEIYFIFHYFTSYHFFVQRNVVFVLFDHCEVLYSKRYSAKLDNVAYFDVPPLKSG
jgi:hypothetical protein